MVTYEVQRQRHLERWGARLPAHLERLRWSAEQLAAERDLALRALVEHARTHSPWHAERLAGVDVGALRAADLGALPTMTKADLMANFDAVVTDPRVTLAGAEAHLAGVTSDAYFVDDLHIVASGGSSGERGVFVYGWDAWADVHLALARRAIADALADPPASDGPMTVAVVAAGNATHMTNAVAATFASPMVETHPLPVTLPLDEVVAGLNALQPDTLTAYASMLAVLATEADAGRLRIAPRRILATSEPLLPEVRAAAEAAFGAPVANCWGTSEAGIVAMGCWQGDGMHLSEDLVIVEPADGKVLVTNLFNPVMPLIRYELTDEMAVLDEPCPCGAAHRRVADIQGRLDDVFTYGPVTVHPHVVRSTLGRCPEVVEYQVRQTRTGIDVDVRVIRPVDETLLAKRLTEALGGAGLADADVTVRAVDAIARHAGTGKLKRFVALAD